MFHAVYLDREDDDHDRDSVQPDDDTLSPGSDCDRLESVSARVPYLHELLVAACHPAR